MADQIPEEAVRGLFDKALQQETPYIDLLGPALADAERVRRRTRAFSVGGAVAGVTAIAVVAVAMTGGSAPRRGEAVGPGGANLPTTTAKQPSTKTTPSATTKAASTAPSSVTSAPSPTGKLPGSPATFTVTSAHIPECQGPFFAAGGAADSDPAMEIGPRTQQDATWVCDQTLTALRNIFPTAQVNAYRASFKFSGAKDSAGRYAPATLGTFQITTASGGQAVFTATGYTAKYQATYARMDTATRCITVGATCVKDGTYTVEIDTNWPEGDSMWVWAANGDGIGLSVSGGTFDHVGTPGKSDLTSAENPLTNAEQVLFSGNANLAKLAEAELQRFAPK